MSNHTPTVTVRLAVIIVASLAALTVGLIWLAIALFIKGDDTGDILYSIGGALAILTAWPVAGTLLDIISDWAAARAK